MEQVKKILENIKNLLISPRFISWYWSVGLVALIQFLNMISENLANLELPNWAVVLLGLALAQATKALSNLKQGKEMGFAPRK